MSQPTEYERQFSFSDYQTENPADPLPGAQVDAELNNVKQTLDQTLTNLALIQRDDGELANESVGVDQLKTEITFGLNAVTDWDVGEVYIPNAGVWYLNKLYRCLESHTSVDFEDDLADDKWSLLLDLATPAADALADEVAAAEDAVEALIAAADTTLQGYVTTASGHATTATTQAGTATTQAGISTTQAGISTAQAVISTAQAAISTTQAGLSDAARIAAQAAQAAAEAVAAGIKWRDYVRAATTTTLPACTYANGASGVGATLTGNANGALAAQDGITLLVNEDLLVKDQAGTLQNGVYTVTQVGTGGTPFILTRRTDSDTWSELISQAVTVAEGTVNADTSFICTVNAGGTIGTTAVVWTSSFTSVKDGGVSTAAKVVDNILTYVKVLTTEFATLANLVSGAASKFVDAVTFALYMDTYVERVVHVQTPTASTDCVIGYTMRAGYDYRFILNALATGTDNASGVQIYMSSDNGATYLSSAGAYTALRDVRSTGSPTGDVSTSTVINSTVHGTDAGVPFHGILELFNPTGASKKAVGFFRYMLTESASSALIKGSTDFTTTANFACNKIKLTSATNFSATGTITVLERKCT